MEIVLLGRPGPLPKPREYNGAYTNVYIELRSSDVLDLPKISSKV